MGLLDNRQLTNYRKAPLDEKIRAPFGGEVVQLATKFSYGNDENHYFAYSRSGQKVGNFIFCTVITHLSGDPATYEALVFVTKDLDYMRLGDSGCWILNTAWPTRSLGVCDVSGDPFRLCHPNRRFL